MQVFLAILSVIAGISITLQTGLNTLLARHMHSSIIAAGISFAVGTVCLFTITVFMKSPTPTLHMIRTTPLFLWVGGALGAYYVFMAVSASSKLGATTFFTLILTGQMITAVIVDHFGIIGFNSQPISWQRIVGVVFLIIGVLLIKRF